MRIDVTTLYLLIVATTFVGAGLTAWQRHGAVAHRREMGLWALGHVCVGLGCLARMLQGQLPDFLAIGVSNLAVLAGYAMVSAGAILFTGRRISPALYASAGLVAVGWLVHGQYAAVEIRIVITATVVAALSFQATLALRGNREAASLSARRFVQILFACHGLFFLGRAAVTLSGIEGEILFTGANFAATMVEGIVWSACAPTALLMMVREKTEKRLTAVSETDFLTGVDNRRAFTTKASKLLESGEAPLSVVVFDLDHFKVINDRHGHATGDEALRLFCRVATSEIAAADIFARLGGEEFAAVLRGRGASDAKRLAIAISKRYTAETTLRLGLSQPATVSAGVAEGRRGAELAELLGEADGALYRAKKGGRDQTVIAEVRSLSPLPESRAA